VAEMEKSKATQSAKKGKKKNLQALWLARKKLKRIVI